MKTVVMAAVAGMVLLGATGTAEADVSSECIICWPVLQAPGISP